jgi:hypothetical protein
MVWLILAFLVGIYVGYKYPDQVGKAVDAGKKMVNDIKDKFGKKETPPNP